MHRRLSPAALAVALLFTIIVPQTFSQENVAQPFTDVEENSRYFTALTYLKNKGVIQGYEDGTFKPAQPVNRAEALKIILLGSQQDIPETYVPLTFPDTGSGAWYAPYLAVGVSAGIIQGYPDGTFKPEQTVNKVENLKMLLKTNQITPPVVTLSDRALFEDTPINSNTLWYQPYVLYAVTSNIAEPKNIFTFGPQLPLTRGEIAESMYRLSVLKETQQIRFDTSQKGIASYYGANFDGRGTASGETFDNESFSAAHRFLPFHTFLQVINTNTGVSTLVKVNDRGPYVADRVVDLSQAGFRAIEKLSRGLSNVKIVPVGIIPNVHKTWIEPENFLDTNTRQTGVTLDKSLPNIFLSQEIYWVTGTTATTAATVTALITDKSTNKKSVVQAAVSDRRFALPLSFAALGKYSISLIPDTVGIGYADVFVLSESYFQNLEFLANTASPHNLQIRFANERANLSWEGNGNNLFKIQLRQNDQTQVWYVNNAAALDIPFADLEKFTTASAELSVQGAKSSTGFSMDRYTDWTSSETLNVTPTLHEYEIYKKDVVTLAPFSQFVTLNTSIHLEGQASIPLEHEVWFTTPAGRTQHLEMSGQNPLAANQQFSFDVPVSESGTYIVEINDTNGEAVFNFPFYASGQTPLLPNPRDLQQDLSPLGTIDLAKERTSLLEQINQERARLSLPPLQTGSQVNNLAQARSDDMAKRNYFAHVTPEGKTAEDLKSEYGLSGPIGENIAKDRTPALGLYGLFRSPAHRNLLLSNLVKEVGLGITRTQDEHVVLTQIFH